ncbi:M20 family metallopeptidase [Acetobacter sp. TBRC 12305]|uniref:M20 family metallopeptidase n=1 Tax=Acetobacter garciniae TaxID=2817435 RepID=A0A939HLX6_9PROT|nr:M20 family metallopeptidase [Acetobacter garciniae]MBO1324441.1 M20 family metallopeptidase [Acetobacter garciniae]MBX0344130.1 M20 family metallopeptidase [Acetobacter garciniae]
MDKADIIARIDEKSCLDFLSMMVRCQSYSETDGEKELARIMVDELEKIGLCAEYQAFEGKNGATRYNAIGRLKGVGGGKSLLFNGHLDTNPVTEGWTVDPWRTPVDDKFIYGIGVSNMKAGDAAYFCALRALIGMGIKLRGDVILTFVVGELQGGVGTVAAIRQGVTADYFINSEPTDLCAVTMHAGSCTFVIELTGNTRHLSKREDATDAIAAACELVPRLNRLTFPGALSPAHEALNRVHVGVIRGALGNDFADWRPPQVADFVRLKGSARYAPGQTFAGVMATLEKELQTLATEFPGLQVKVTGDEGMPAFEVSPSSRIVNSLNAAYELVRGTPQPTGEDKPARFYGTDAGHLYHELGLEGVVCGPGGRYNTMPDERVDIIDYLDMIRIYMLVILDICGVEEA